MLDGHPAPRFQAVRLDPAGLPTLPWAHLSRHSVSLDSDWLYLPVCHLAGISTLRDVQTLSDLVLAHLKGALNDPTRAWLHCILWLRYTHATHLGAVTPLGYARPLSCSQLYVDVIAISALSGSTVTTPPPAPQALKRQCCLHLSSLYRVPQFVSELVTVPINLACLRVDSWPVGLACLRANACHLACLRVVGFSGCLRI